MASSLRSNQSCESCTSLSPVIQNTLQLYGGGRRRNFNEFNGSSIVAKVERALNHVADREHHDDDRAQIEQLRQLKVKNERLRREKATLMTLTENQRLMEENRCLQQQLNINHSYHEGDVVQKNSTSNNWYKI